MRELNVNEVINVSGGLSNIGLVLISSTVGGLLGIVTGMAFFQGSLIAGAGTGILGVGLGMGAGFFIVLSAAALKFAGSDVSV